MSVTATENWETPKGASSALFVLGAEGLSKWIIVHRKAIYFRTLIASLGIVWGLQISLSKLTGEEHGATTGGLLFIHLILIGMFGTIVLAQGKVFLPRVNEIAFYAISAVMVNIAPLTLELTIARHMSAGLLTLISSLSPIMTITLVLIVRCEDISWQRLSGVLVGVASASAIIIPQALVGEVTLYWVGLAFVLPIIAAAYGIYIKQFWPKNRTPLQVTAGILVVGALLVLPVHFANSAGPSMNLDIGAASLPLIALTLSIAAEFYLYSLLVRTGGAVLASCADFVAVLAGFGWGYLIFDERLDTGVWLAMALGTVALWLVCHQPRNRKTANRGLR